MVTKGELANNLALSIANGFFRVPKHFDPKWSTSALKLNADPACRADDSDLIASSLALGLWFIKKFNGPFGNQPGYFGI